MSRLLVCAVLRSTPPFLGCLLTSFLALWAADTAAQAVSTLSTRAVGGVSINPEGVLENADLDVRGQLRQVRAGALQAVPAELGQMTTLRKVSLARLDKAIQEQLQTGKPLPDAMKYLAGLQRIEYVLVYPEKKDLVLAGPGEGWKVDAYGNLVGLTTGRAVMLLDDLLLALRSAQQAAQGGISCSIDPTSDGLKRLKGLVSTLKTVGPNPQGTVEAIRQTLGPQTISVQGVPATSHFARVLVAADYRMKRIAMDLEPAPIRGLPSFLQMMQSARSGMSSLLPRWWLAPKFEPLLRDGDGLAWQLRGAGVKTMTEEDFVAADGSRENTGRANPVAQRWADLMTNKYEDLALAEPIFGQLRNCMELAVVSALITKERLTEKAGCSLPALFEGGRLANEQFPAPRQVDSQASVVKKGKSWLISASGGVQIDSWGAAQKTQQDSAPGQVRAQAAAKANAWWWN